MTPKEKAEMLVYKYLCLQEPNYNWFNKTLAIRCALIAVDEIIKSNPIQPLSFMLESEALDAGSEYWQEVKQEVEKL